MQYHFKPASLFGKIKFSGILSFVMCGMISWVGYCSPEEALLKDKTNNSESNIIETGEFNGRVFDAVTGKPIEGVMVVYRWDVNVAFYDTTTDENGNYHIPSRSIDWSGYSSPEPEEVIVYKLGYLWYHVEEGLASSFMIYVPGLTQRYSRKDNLVRLQPWIEEFSHHEHIDIFERDWDYPKVPSLEEALQPERTLAKSPKLPEKKAPQHFERKTVESHTTNKKRETSNSYGAGIMVLGGKSALPENPRDAEERKIQKIRNEVNRLCADYKKGDLPENEYKERLYQYLEISDYEVLGKTAKALKELDDYSAIPVLIEYLKENIYQKWNFRWALSPFRIVTGRMDLPESTDVVSERIEIVQDIELWWQRNKDKNESQWRHDLVSTGKTDPARMKAMREIRENKDISALPSILQCLNSNEGDSLYEQAILTLSEIGDQSVIPHIKKKLYHENVYVRRQSALTLNKFGDKTGIPVMIASLDSPSENTRSVANAVLREITGQDFNDNEDIKSLRHLPTEQQEAVVQRWKQWWQDNKENFINYQADDISNILKTDDEVLNKRYKEMLAAARNNPEAPVFDDPRHSPEFCFKQFKTALENGDINKAVSFFVPHERKQRKELFEQIGSKACHNFAKGLGPILFEDRLEDMFFYEMVIETDEGISAFPVTFTQFEEGKWMILNL